MEGADPIRRLVHAFSRLPGIGEKTASRLTFFVMDADETVARDLAEALLDLRSRVHLCPICCNLTDRELCNVCSDPRRDRRVVCVVESVPGLMAIERTGAFHGTYHVLHGVLAPLEGVGPEQLHMRELVARLKDGVEELIVATNTSIEGEATALYLSKLATPLGIHVTRIASGVPMGADLEYADQVTLARALAGRHSL